MPRFKLTVEYAGTRYSGWQIQKNAKTVQGEIDRAIRTVTGRTDFELYGSGRTDAGVHALAQVAHLDVASPLAAESLRRRLNDELPSDINVLAAVVVPHRFHARHDAVGRRYLYQVARRRTAFAKAFVWWVKEPIDTARMRAASSAFVGMHDFLSFAESEGSRTSRAERAARQTAGERGHEPPRPSTKVLVDRLEIADDGDLVLIAIEGSHFLWKMVRRVVGVLVEIGRGELDPAAASRFLTEASDVPARLTAPPSGLFLERVYYAGDPRVTAITAAMPLRPARD
jgi:tRNA pseudouridine38-40 synthase